MRELFIIGFLCYSVLFFAQTKQNDKNLTRVLFVFDASRSMKTQHGGKTRIVGAKELFYDFLTDCPGMFLSIVQGWSFCYLRALGPKGL